MVKINNVHKDELYTFDFVKVKFSADKPKNGKHCTVRYKGVSFCLTKDNMDLIFEFIQRMNHAGSFQN